MYMLMYSAYARALVLWWLSWLTDKLLGCQFINVCKRCGIVKQFMPIARCTRHSSWKLADWKDYKVLHNHYTVVAAIQRYRKTTIVVRTRRPTGSCTHGTWSCTGWSYAKPAASSSWSALWQDYNCQLRWSSTNLDASVSKPKFCDTSVRRWQH